MSESAPEPSRDPDLAADTKQVDEERDRGSFEILEQWFLGIVFVRRRAEARRKKSRSSNRSHRPGRPSPPPNGSPSNLHPIEVIERWFFGAVFVLLVFATALPVLIRWANAIFGSTFNVPSSLSVLTPQFVLAIALIGASAASRDRKHIAIDVVGPFLKPRAKLFLRSATQALASIVVLIVIPASFKFLGQEMERDTTSRFFDLPIWIEFAIVPLGLLLIGVRLAVAAGVDGWRAARNEIPPPKAELPTDAVPEAEAP